MKARRTYTPYRKGAVDFFIDFFVYCRPRQLPLVCLEKMDRIFPYYQINVLKPSIAFSLQWLFV